MYNYISKIVLGSIGYVFYKNFVELSCKHVFYLEIDWLCYNIILPSLMFLLTISIK